MILTDDIDQYPWLIDEKASISQTIKSGRPTIGICLGAQLISDVLGGVIRANSHLEIGWHEVTRCSIEDLPVWAIALPEKFKAFHWHGETFDLPPNAVHLARSEACQNQAFSIGDQILGLQFHLESDIAAINRLIQHCGADIEAAGPYVQTESQIRDETEIPQASNICFELLDAFADRVSKQLQ